MTRYTILGFSILAAALATAACSDDTSGPGATSSTSAGGGGGGGGDGGAGGDPDGKDPSEVTSADECVYEGTGGSDAFRCSTARIEFAEPVPVDALTFVVDTSEGDVFDVSSADLPLGVRVEVEADQGGGDGGAGGGGGPGGGSGQVATALVVYVDSPPPHYDPAWIDVQVRVGGEVVGAKRFEDLTFACVAYSQDNWCWESEPVTLPIEAAE
ncbi:uncharacterized protein SOCE26_056660 [Sorangium cellulosum]|uniref:Secreted protein n=1 Tax=Sorangium cellulosum TaxID=56 RepID=A0A2L0EY23_SORCE|nr:hypothetical protein [Sorangium cellulosum]AUX44202.1 uncharacterized protein SOCE26_056660 [Sorangium cellulosum]